jgi:hypothetical protein
MTTPNCNKAFKGQGAVGQKIFLVVGSQKRVETDH